MLQLMTDGILRFLANQPQAFAHVRGSESFPDVQGLVTFYDFFEGTIVMADISGLPDSEEPCERKFYGFHIHEGASCTGNETDPFADAGAHYNPDGCPHPAHAGDMPVLEGNRGRAWLAFYTERFTPAQVRGKTVIVHDMADDYHSQPSGTPDKRWPAGLSSKLAWEKRKVYNTNNMLIFSEYETRKI